MYGSPCDERLNLVPGDTAGLIEVHFMPDILKALVSHIGCVLELVAHLCLQQLEILTHWSSL
jgi:hypothetical protein